jgi:hypothetical protein
MDSHGLLISLRHISKVMIGKIHRIYISTRKHLKIAVNETDK